MSATQVVSREELARRPESFGPGDTTKDFFVHLVTSGTYRGTKTRMSRVTAEVGPTWKRNGCSERMVRVYIGQGAGAFEAQWLVATKRADGKWTVDHPKC